jgi:hypothetical protein
VCGGALGPPIVFGGFELRFVIHSCPSRLLFLSFVCGWVDTKSRHNPAKRVIKQQAFLSCLYVLFYPTLFFVFCVCVCVCSKVYIERGHMIAPVGRIVLFRGGGGLDRPENTGEASVESVGYIRVPSRVEKDIEFDRVCHTRHGHVVYDRLGLFIPYIGGGTTTLAVSDLSKTQRIIFPRPGPDTPPPAKNRRVSSSQRDAPVQNECFMKQSWPILVVPRWSSVPSPVQAPLVLGPFPKPLLVILPACTKVCMSVCVCVWV